MTTPPSASRASTRPTRTRTSKYAVASPRYQPILSLLQNGEAHVEIVQHTEFKSQELISFEFHTLEEESIRAMITRKYQLLKQRL